MVPAHLPSPSPGRRWTGQVETLLKVMPLPLSPVDVGQQWYARNRLGLNQLICHCWGAGVGEFNFPSRVALAGVDNAVAEAGDGERCPTHIYLYIERKSRLLTDPAAKAGRTETKPNWVKWLPKWFRSSPTWILSSQPNQKVMTFWFLSLPRPGTPPPRRTLRARPVRPPL